ncbi:hypothetical protein PHYC_03494 [Phycisphaerales bacterium]|nr:hypothetical protein PHYC_03494 [Phycisphaerales bacterium]
MTDFRPAPGFRQRLGYYVIGLAIGCTLLGILWYMRALAAKNQPQPTGSGLTPQGETGR